MQPNSLRATRAVGRNGKPQPTAPPMRSWIAFTTRSDQAWRLGRDPQGAASGMAAQVRRQGLRMDRRGCCGAILGRDDWSERAARGRDGESASEPHTDGSQERLSQPPAGRVSRSCKARVAGPCPRSPRSSVRAVRSLSGPCDDRQGRRWPLRCSRRDQQSGPLRSLRFAVIPVQPSKIGTRSDTKTRASARRRSSLNRGRKNLIPNLTFRIGHLRGQSVAQTPPGCPFPAT